MGSQKAACRLGQVDLGDGRIHAAPHDTSWEITYIYIYILNCRIRILKVLRCIYSRYKSYPGPNHGTFRFLSRWPVAAYGSRQMTGSLDGSLLSINAGRILRHDRQVPIVDGYIHIYIYNIYIYIYIYIYHVISLENPLKNLKSPHDILIRNHGHPAPGEFKHSWGTAEKLYKSEVRWDSDSYGVDHSDQRAEVSLQTALENFSCTWASWIWAETGVLCWSS